MATDTPTNDFLDETTIGTMGAATAGVVAVSVVFRKAFRINHPLVPLVTSFLISFGLASSKGTLDTFLGWLIGALNGCLLFCAAVGANETVVDFVAERPAGQGKIQGAKPMPWFKSIFDR